MPRESGRRARGWIAMVGLACLLALGPEIVSAQSPPDIATITSSLDDLFVRRAPSRASRSRS